jgi:hypothetical protein
MSFGAIFNEIDHDVLGAGNPNVGIPCVLPTKIEARHAGHSAGAA